MSLLSEIKKLSGQYRSNASRPAHETRPEHATRSFDIPVRESVKDDSVAAIKEELERSREMLAGIKTEVANLESMQASLKDYLEAQKKETSETIHNENVRVYRNVQAVVLDESSKIKETFEKTNSDAFTKVNLAFIFAILAFGVAFLHFLFDILDKVGVF